MTPPPRDCFRKFCIVSSNGKPFNARRLGAAPGVETLMPYEAAAKAIYIRANGAAAYYQATGLAPAANDA